MLPKTPSSSLLGQCVPSSQTHIPGKIPPCPHLVLHFDINETILVGDEAGGDSPEACLNKMLAKSAFVLMDNVVRECEDQQPEASRRALKNTKNIKPTKWWDGTPLQARCMSPTLPANPPPLYTEFSWPPNSCPYYRTSFKHKAKSFTKHDGAPYLSLYHQLDDKCSLLRNQCRNSGGFCEHSSTLHHILPAFFHTLNELKRQKKSFSLVFRTFGSDLPGIADALNLFARGEHPNFPNFRDKSLILTEQQMYRGRWRREAKEDEYEYYLQRWSKDEEIVASGDAEVLEILENQAVSGVQDHYDFWDKHNNSPLAGKPIWARQTVSQIGGAPHHILFDDNIHNDPTDSIAAVRVKRGEGKYSSLSGEDILAMQGIHLVRVPTVDPLLNQNWFLDRINEAEERLSNSIGGESATSDSGCDPHY